MAGNFIKDLPLFSNVKATDELIVERVEGDVRTTGRTTIDAVLGWILPTPVIGAITQDGTIVALDGRFERYTSLKIDGSVYPFEVEGDAIHVDITGLEAGEHTFTVYNAYKTASATFVTA